MEGSRSRHETAGGLCPGWVVASADRGWGSWETPVGLPANAF